jgi:hypothetical protein
VVEHPLRSLRKESHPSKQDAAEPESSAARDIATIFRFSLSGGDDGGDGDGDDGGQL